MASRVRLNLPYPEAAAEPERPPPPLIKELLEEIFLRVASSADLARASAACVSFRRLITDHSFLRRYRSIHPPLLLGFVSSAGFHPVEAPHPSAAVARAVDRAAGFSFDFLPRPTGIWNRWLPFDVRNGRVLVGCRGRKSAAYWDLAVCYPLSRRYLLLPPITDDLLASVEMHRQNMFHPKASFIPSGGIEEDTSFSVILWMESYTMLGIFVFSSVSGCWSVTMSTNCDVLGLNRIGVLVSAQCVSDCFYWKLYNMSMVIKLDMNTMQFCTFDLPPGHNQRRIVIVESGRNKFGLFSMNREGTSVDYYTFSQNGSENSHEWHMMSTISLPADYNINLCFTGIAEGYIFLQGIPIEHGAKHRVLFSLDTKSFKIERVSTAIFAFSGHPYFGFLPSMSPQGYGEAYKPKVVEIIETTDEPSNKKKRKASAKGRQPTKKKKATPPEPTAAKQAMQVPNSPVTRSQAKQVAVSRRPVTRSLATS